MLLRVRFHAVLAALLLALSVSGQARAQVEGNPVAEATPAASTGGADLAAMTLDSSSIPDDFLLLGEGYTPIEVLADSLLGQVDRDELLATGIERFYQSYYVNAQGHILRSYAIAYETVADVRAGFDLLEDEVELVPNGFFEDQPGLPGVGEEPAEISSGIIQNGDGTQSASYDVTFRIDRFHVGAAMEIRDGTEPASALVDDLARQLAVRVADVVAGNDVSGVVYGLPGELIELDAPLAFEGYQALDETFLVEDPATLPDGYLGGYYRAASFSESISSILPYVTIGVNKFDTAADVQAALAQPEAMLPFFPDLEQVEGIEIEGADKVVAVSFTSPQGQGTMISVHIFAQVDDRLISVDVQGMPSLDDAQVTAMTLAELQIACTMDAYCDEPGSIVPAM